VLGDPRPIITVPNVLHSAGKTVKGDAGGSIKVHEVTRGKDGSLHLRFEVEQPPDIVPDPGPGFTVPPLNLKPVPVIPAGPAAGAVPAPVPLPAPVPPGGRIVPAAGPGRLGRPAFRGGAHGVRLVDGEGNVLPARIAVSRQRGPGGTPTLEYQLEYTSPSGQGEPARLVFAGRKSVTIDVPFTLTDVPLP
jgi:hypothetical protein